MNWIEVDFKDVVNSKHELIQSKEQLSSVVGEFTFSGGDLVSSSY